MVTLKWNFRKYVNRAPEELAHPYEKYFSLNSLKTFVITSRYHAVSILCAVFVLYTPIWSLI